MAASRQTRRLARRPEWSRPRSGSLSASSRIRVIPPSALDVRLRERRRNAAGVLGQRDRQVRCTRSRRQQGARQAGRESVRVRQALPAVLRRYRLQRLHDRSRTSAPWSAVVRCGDIGIVAQRYELVLFGSHQRLELQPWQPETQRTARVPFAWTKDAWYTMKLEVQNMGGGKVRARGKVWPRGEAEPAAWTIERIDPIGSAKGAAGLYADAPSAGWRRSRSCITTTSSVREQEVSRDQGSGARRSALENRPT